MEVSTTRMMMKIKVSPDEVPGSLAEVLEGADRSMVDYPSPLLTSSLCM
jgi:hypothetical protein